MATRSHAPAGALLREWRTARRISQLTLSLQTGVSSRHLSYLETGRSQPSREMVLRLAEALDVPLRHRNELLVAAGYAPRYFESDLDAPEMAAVRRAVDLILQHQEPYPAFVLDRHWNIRMTNRAAERCTRFLLGRDADEANIVRLLLHPDGLRRSLVSFDETTGDLIRHLRAQVAAAPGDDAAAALLEEVLSYPGIPRHVEATAPGVRPEPLLTTVFRRDDVELRLFSTFTTFGTPRDVTLDELRIECSFPADDATAEACRRLFSD
ncbi:MAG: helix-turn-helix transcriptional regulator [Gemmatimonadota bacterium]|nr:helix-turn-helix transcriptional regulator [Gemmatimonadota bacterium]